MKRNVLGVPVFTLHSVSQEERQICKGSVLLVCNSFQISNKTDTTNVSVNVLPLVDRRLRLLLIAHSH